MPPNRDLTEISLVQSSINTVKRWKFDKTWPKEPKDILEKLVKDTRALLPHLVVIANYAKGRPDIKWPDPNTLPLPFGWSPQDTKNLYDAVLDWLKSSTFLKSQNGTYWCTYALETNRVNNLWDLYYDHLITAFNISPTNKGGINGLLAFCYVIGNPLTQVQKRTIDQVKRDAICIPREVQQSGL